MSINLLTYFLTYTEYIGAFVLGNQILFRAVPHSYFWLFGRMWIKCE